MIYTIKARVGGKVMVDEERDNLDDARTVGVMFVLSGDTRKEGLYEIYSLGEPVESSMWIPEKQMFEKLDVREWY